MFALPSWRNRDRRAAESRTTSLPPRVMLMPLGESNRCSQRTGLQATFRMSNFLNCRRFLKTRRLRSAPFGKHREVPENRRGFSRRDRGPPRNSASPTVFRFGSRQVPWGSGGEFNWGGGFERLCLWPIRRLRCLAPRPRFAGAHFLGTGKRFPPAQKGAGAGVRGPPPVWVARWSLF